MLRVEIYAVKIQALTAIFCLYTFYMVSEITRVVLFMVAYLLSKELC